MKRTFLLIITLTIAGCAEPAPSASTLQRLDRLAPTLRSASTRSARVAGEWSRLAASVSAANVPAVQRQATILQRDSYRLAARDSVAAASLRHLGRGGSRRVVKQYLSDLEQALSAQWWEAREVGWTARLLGRDPLLEEGGDAADLGRLSDLARGAAQRAVTYAGASQALRRRDRRLFRYVPVLARKW